jgi:hypothetical protein
VVPSGLVWKQILDFSAYLWTMLISFSTNAK